MYVVKTPGGFLGTRRFTGAGSMRPTDRPFEKADIFTKAGAAQASLGHDDWVRMSVEVSLK